MATLQVRSIGDDLYHALGVKATMENRSISQEVISIIKENLSGRAVRSSHVGAGFLDLCGTWEDNRDAQEIAEDIRNARVSRGRAERKALFQKSTFNVE